MKLLRLSCAVIGVVMLASGATFGEGTATTPGPGEMNAHFINVGQGSSVLLELACGAALIDTGGEKNARFDSTAALQGYLSERSVDPLGCVHHGN